MKPRNTYYIVRLEEYDAAALAKLCTVSKDKNSGHSLKSHGHGTGLHYVLPSDEVLLPRLCTLLLGETEAAALPRDFSLVMPPSLKHRVQEHVFAVLPKEPAGGSPERAKSAKKRGGHGK